MAVIPQYGQLANIMGQKQQTIPDKAKQPQGTGYTNLQRILGANQGNKLGEAVVGGIQNSGQQAQQNLQKQQTQFGQGLETQRQHLAGEQGLVQGTFGKLDAPDYQEGGVTEGEASGFQNLRNEKYSGPTGLANADQIRKQAQQVAQYGQMAGNREGRQELLRTMVGGANYTAPQQRLDELFLAQSQPQLMQAANQQKQLSKQAQRAITAAQGQGQAQAAALQQLQQNTEQGLGTRQTGVDTAVSDRVKQYLQNQQDLYGQAQTQLGTGEVQKDLADKIGLSLGNAQVTDMLGGENTGTTPITSANFYKGFDPLAFLHESPEANKTTAMSQSEAAKLAALAQLRGQQGYVGPDKSLVGTYDPNKAVSYESAGLQDALANQQNAYNQKFGTTYFNPWAANDAENAAGLSGGPGRGGGPGLFTETPVPFGWGNSYKLGTAAQDVMGVPWYNVDTNKMQQTIQGEKDKLSDQYGANKKIKIV